MPVHIILRTSHVLVVDKVAVLVDKEADVFNVD